MDVAALAHINLIRPELARILSQEDDCTEEGCALLSSFIAAHKGSDGFSVSLMGTPVDPRNPSRFGMFRNYPPLHFAVAHGKPNFAKLLVTAAGAAPCYCESIMQRNALCLARTEVMARTLVAAGVPLTPSPSPTAASKETRPLFVLADTIGDAFGAFSVLLPLSSTADLLGTRVHDGLTLLHILALQTLPSSQRGFSVHSFEAMQLFLDEIVARIRSVADQRASELENGGGGLPHSELSVLAYVNTAVPRSHGRCGETALSILAASSSAHRIPKQSFGPYVAAREAMFARLLSLGSSTCAEGGLLPPPIPNPWWCLRSIVAEICAAAQSFGAGSDCAVYFTEQLRRVLEIVASSACDCGADGAPSSMLEALPAGTGTRYLASVALQGPLACALRAAAANASDTQGIDLSRPHPSGLCFLDSGAQLPPLTRGQQEGEEEVLHILLPTAACCSVLQLDDESWQEEEQQLATGSIPPIEMAARLGCASAVRALLEDGADTEGFKLIAFEDEDEEWLDRESLRRWVMEEEEGDEEEGAETSLPLWHRQLRALFSAFRRAEGEGFSAGCGKSDDAEAVALQGDRKAIFSVECSNTSEVATVSRVWHPQGLACPPSEDYGALAPLVAACAAHMQKNDDGDQGNKSLSIVVRHSLLLSLKASAGAATDGYRAIIQSLLDAGADTMELGVDP